MGSKGDYDTSRAACLNKKMTIMLFLKQSCDKQKPYCQKLYNDYSKIIDNFPLTVQEQHTNFDAWKPAYMTTVKNNDICLAREVTPKKKHQDNVPPGDQQYDVVARK